MLNEKDSWGGLYESAIGVLNSRIISPFVRAGEVAAAVLTDKGNVYVGICIDTSCALGICAERNAMANMLTNGESNIHKLVCLTHGGKPILPCAACRESLMQLNTSSAEIEILLELSSLKTIRLKEVIPSKWNIGQFG